jgi:hypothetical protein
MVLLQRLPGLGVDREEEGTRAFIDEDFADACRAGDLVQFIDNPYAFERDMLGTLECATGSLGVAVAARHCEIRRFSAGKVSAAIRRAHEVSPGNFAADLARVAIECGHPLEGPLSVHGVFIPDLEFTTRTGNASQLAFQECFFSRIGIDADVDDDALPKFIGCFIDEIDGRISREDLPAASFDSECIIESFTTPAATTAAVLSLGLPLGTRVVLTILKKLYQRRGAGRKENALFRGLDHRARRLVGGALQLIQHEGLAVPSRRGDETIWLPDRSSMRRVGRIIAAPTSHDDPLLRAAADLD